MLNQLSGNSCEYFYRFNDLYQFYAVLNRETDWFVLCNGQFRVFLVEKL